MHETDLLTVREAADLLGVSATTVRNWVRSHDLPMVEKTSPGGAGHLLIGLRSEIETWRKLRQKSIPGSGRPRKGG